MNVACDYEAPMQMLTTKKYIAARPMCKVLASFGEEISFSKNGTNLTFSAWLLGLIRHIPRLTKQKQQNKRNFIAK